MSACVRVRVTQQFCGGLMADDEQHDSLALTYWDNPAKALANK